MKWKIDNQYKNIVLFGNFLVVSTIVDMQFNIDVKWLKSIIVKKIYFWLFIRKSKQTQNPKIGLFRSLKFIFKYHCNYGHNFSYHHWYQFCGMIQISELEPLSECWMIIHIYKYKPRSGPKIQELATSDHLADNQISVTCHSEFNYLFPEITYSLQWYLTLEIIHSVR